MSNKTVCYLNGKKYEVDRQKISDYIDTWSHKFTNEEKKEIVDDVCFRLDSLDVDTTAIQEFNFVEDAYTDAAICYIFEHNNSVKALIQEEDDLAVFDYMGYGKIEPEEERE